MRRGFGLWWPIRRQRKHILRVILAWLTSPWVVYVLLDLAGDGVGTFWAVHGWFYHRWQLQLLIVWIVAFVTGVALIPIVNLLPQLNMSCTLGRSGSIMVKAKIPYLLAMIDLVAQPKLVIMSHDHCSIRASSSLFVSGVSLIELVKLATRPTAMENLAILGIIVCILMLLHSMVISRLICTLVMILGASKLATSRTTHRLHILTWAHLNLRSSIVACSPTMTNMAPTLVSIRIVKAALLHSRS